MTKTNELNCFESKVYDFLKQYISPNENSILIIGFSGGADSTSLLLVLHNLNIKLNMKLQIIPVHINHMIRKEAVDDEIFASNVAKQLSLNLITKSINIPDIAVIKKMGIEECARNERYKIFEQVAKQYNSNFVLTAHNYNDFVETVLMRMTRGCNINGLVSIYPKRSISPNSKTIVCRPLLFISRNEIETYLKSEQVNFCVDKSNLSTKYFRNKVRLNILPYLRNIIPDIDSRLFGIGMSAFEFKNKYEQKLNVLLENAVIKQSLNTVELSVRKLQQYPKFLATTIVNSAIRRLINNPPDFSLDHYERLYKIISENKDTSISLPSKLECIKRDNTIALNLKKDLEKKDKYKLQTQPVSIKIGEINDVPHYKMVLHVNEIKGKEFAFNLNGYEEVVDYDKIKQPLLLRTREQGDKFNPLGLNNEIKLKEYFINEKVPVEKRARIPLLCDSEKIVWIVGHRISNKVKVDSSTRRILKLTAILN